MLWCSLEAVFTGGDIAKQMPTQAKQFQQIDKGWARIMSISNETRLVKNTCENDIIKTMLPDLEKGLIECQKQLESYLETKKKKFPRFYFVSNDTLLNILSQGSDPDAIQGDLENLFDAITSVDFDEFDKTLIIRFNGLEKGILEPMNCTTPVKAQGNVEDWLKKLEDEMKRTTRYYAFDGIAKMRAGQCEPDSVVQ